MALEWTTTICSSHLQPTCQLTMPSIVARELREKRKKYIPALLETDGGVRYQCDFERQKNRNGGWRARKDHWKQFLINEPVLDGDVLSFEVIHIYQFHNIALIKVKNERINYHEVNYGYNSE